MTFRDPSPRCRAPGCFKTAVHQHHVVYEQHVRRDHGDISNPDNALALCREHHLDHHWRNAVLPVSCLRPENFAFALALMGEERAEDYFWRYYASTEVD